MACRGDLPTRCLQLRAEEYARSQPNAAVVPTGQRHALRDQLTTDAVDFFEFVKQSASAKNGAVRVGGNGSVTKLVCGGMVYPLLAILPPVLHVKRTEEGVRRLGMTTAHLRSELGWGK